MAPLLVLIGVTLLARAVGVVWIALDSWVVASRVGLAAMLLFTASAHFSHRRAGMLQMVPGWVPRPETVVTLTGLIEVLAAIGLFILALRPLVGILLVLYLIAVFPANVQAARQANKLGNYRTTPLWLRAPIQLIFIAVALWVSLPA
jgi:uncharacterized membrane protein